MMISNVDKAQILVQALPYIQNLRNKTVVVKYGGNAMINNTLKDAVISDIVLLSLVGIHVVLVHGGGPEISEMLKKTGKENRFVNGLRYTDAETMEIVQMVLAGKVNKDLVKLLEQCNGRAVGLCGIDGGMIEAERITDEDLGFVGNITAINTELIENAIEKGCIPVIATMGCGTDGTVYNINADTAAAKLASALNAEKLILLTDVRGLLRDKEDESSLIPVVKVSEVPELVRKGMISGGMIPKIDCCVEAVRQGVKRTHIIDGRIEHSILIEIFSHEGIGTMLL